MQYKVLPYTKKHSKCQSQSLPSRSQEKIYFHKFIQNGTKCAVTKDSRRLNLEEGEIQASRVTLVMRDTITSFLRRDSRVIKPFRSVSWSAVHDNTNDHTGKGIEAADMEYNGNFFFSCGCLLASMARSVNDMEYNGNDPTNLKGLALKFLDIIDRVEAFRGISWSQNEGVASFIHERIVANEGRVSTTGFFLRFWGSQNCPESAHDSFCLIRPFFNPFPR